MRSTVPSRSARSSGRALESINRHSMPIDVNTVQLIATSSAAVSGGAMLIAATEAAFSGLKKGQGGNVREPGSATEDKSK